VIIGMTYQKQALCTVLV